MLENINVDLAEDSEILTVLTAQDPDNYELTYSITNSPSFGDYVLNANFLTYIPNNNYNGLDSLTYIVNDGELSSDEAYIIYNIDPVDDTPVLQELENTIIDEDNLFIISAPIAIKQHPNAIGGLSGFKIDL